ncbi:putative Gonadotropin-releasing hormone receptor [Hypsibius exemplaris]|uniref:Gonadotropin-releasing hormone receptor n=1 Tax=Hypsibius exemplaris TaxID=2072580 RepID=A0A9X6RLI8_HYPEX|nr:putative Gonadotropin-releasing hormone receptor [Hypsibius exemplaris]
MIKEATGDENYYFGLSDFQNSSWTFDPTTTPYCPGNWTVINRFIGHNHPWYFINRPWIIGGLFSLAVVGLVSNVAVLAYLFRRPHVWRSAFSLLVMQLAVADAMVCLFCLLADALWNITMEWLGGTDLCRFIKFMQMFSLYSSAMILTGMTVERCIAVTYPFTMSRPQTAMQRVKIISMTVWSMAAICSVPQAIIFHVERAPICADFFQCVTFGTYTEPWQEILYTMSTLLIMFLIPVLIIIACFLIIFTKITQETRLALGKQRSEEAQTDKELINLSPDCGFGREMYRRTRSFSLWTTSAIAVVFIFCWAPYYTSMAAYLFHFELSNGWMALILSFGMTSTVLNPLIYGLFRFLKRKTLRMPSDPESKSQLLSRSSPTAEARRISLRRWTLIGFL